MADDNLCRGDGRLHANLKYGLSLALSDTDTQYVRSFLLDLVRVFVPLKDILEHRFAHLRMGIGTHRNPSKEVAYGRGRTSDGTRIMHGNTRRNASRRIKTLGDIVFLDLGADCVKLALPVNAFEKGWLP